jgi:hypothetical protein
VSVGSWSATKGAPPDLNFTCTPPAPLPWAACEALPKGWKPPPAKNTSHAKLWPLPERYTNGSISLRVVPPPTNPPSFFKLAKGASPLLSAAFERYGASPPSSVQLCLWCRCLWRR